MNITRVSDLDRLVEELLQKGEGHDDYRDERLPYWADLWHSAVGLSRVIATTDLDWTGKKVLEIGCGLGLPGIVAGMRGAEVTLSDYMPEALDLVRYNWMQNLGDRPATFRRLDWREVSPEDSADIVLAADVAYEERFFQPLFAAFDQLVRPGGDLLLSEPGRSISEPFLQAFPRHGWRIEREWQQREVVDGHPRTVSVFHFCRIGTPAAY